MGRSHNGDAVIARLRAKWAAMTVERVRAAVARERERCARIVESYVNAEVEVLIAKAAAEIRSGR